MNKVKGVIFVLSGLFIMITLVSLLIPSKVMTVRSVVVHTSAANVLSEVTDLKNWRRWHPVFQQDSSTIVISEPSSGVNAFATWNTSGKQNKMLITESFASGIKMSLIRKGENTIENIISVQSVEDSTALQIEWRVLTRLKWYPWEKFYGIFLDKITGPGYEIALNNLKETAEAKEQ